MQNRYHNLCVGRMGSCSKQGAIPDKKGLSLSLGKLKHGDYSLLLQSAMLKYGMPLKGRGLRL